MTAHRSNTPVVPMGGLCVQRGLTCLLVLLATNSRYHILPIGGTEGELQKDVQRKMESFGFVVTVIELHQNDFLANGNGLE